MAANCCQRMCHFGLSHIFETSGWNNITFGSQCAIGIIHSFSEFDVGMAPSDLERLRGGGGALQQDASAGRFELKTLGEKVGNSQSLPSDFVLLGASFSVY